MYSKRFRNPHRIVEQDFPSKPIKVYKPFSHYVLGGSDLTGEHTDCTARIINDTPEAIASGCGPNSLCDPRVGFWEMAQEIGATRSKKMATTKESTMETPIVPLSK